MTVGLYINAPTAVMISDCLASPVKSENQIYSPSNIEYHDGENGELARLVSKFVYPDDQTIITFAGRSSHIKEFIECFPKRWRERDQNMRPMEFLQKIDYELRAIRNGWNCSVLGASIMPTTTESNYGIVNNYASESKNWKFKTTHFGDCYSIGSGSSALRKFVENADKNISESNSQNPLNLYQLLGGMNGEALYFQNEIPESQTWGGLLQAQFFDNFERKWVRAPTWFHCCVLFTGRNLDYLGLHPKIVLHSSKEGTLNSSAVLTSVKKGNLNQKIIAWPVYSPFYEEKGDFTLHQVEFFKLPSHVTISVIVELTGKTLFNHFTYEFSRVEGIKFDTHESNVSFGVDAHELSGWMRQSMIKSFNL